MHIFINSRSLRGLRNCAGAESPRALGAGIINLDSSSTGRAIAHAFLNELYSTFNGAAWGANGPGVITRVLQQMCQVKKVKHALGGISLSMFSTSYHNI